MKKTISINIASTAFFIDDDAFACLNEYLKKIEAWFSNKEGGQEIISDIETRLSELFLERINPQLGVITIQHVNEVIGIMGQPEDFTGEGDETTVDDEGKEKKHATEFESPRRRRLYRDPDNKVLGGVCSGIAAYFNIDPVIVRVIFAVLPFLSFGVIIPVYIVLWIVMPEAITTSQKLEMRGEDINVSNIEKKIKEEYQDVKKRFRNIRNTQAYQESESYIRRMNQRDRTVLIVVGVVLLALFMSKLIGMPFQLFHMIHWPVTFSGLFFPGLFFLIVLLLVLGLIFRSALKGFILLIILLIVISILVKFAGWIFPFHHWSFSW